MEKHEGSISRPDTTGSRVLHKLATIALSLVLALFVVFAEARASVGVASIEYSPDGSKILVMGGGSFVLESRTGKILYKIPSQSLYTYGSFSQDGRFVIAKTTKGVSVFDSASGKELYTADYLGYSIGFRSFSTSPDGRYLLAGHFMGFGVLFDLQGGWTFVRKVEIGRAEIVSVRWNAAGTAAYFGTDNGQVHLVNVETGEKLASAFKLSAVQAMELSQSNDALLVATNRLNSIPRGNLYALDPITLAKIETVRLPKSINSVSIAGDRIATCLRQRKDVEIWQVASKVSRRVPLGYSCNPIGLSPDGQTIVDAVTVKRDVIIRAVDSRTGRTRWSIRRSPLRP